MNSIAIGSISFACMFGGALIGWFLRKRLPEEHLDPDSKDVVKLGAGLIATMGALVLGLMVSSAKGSYDKVNDGLIQMAANVANLDRILDEYGRRQLTRASFCAAASLPGSRVSRRMPTSKREESAATRRRQMLKHWTARCES